MANKISAPSLPTSTNKYYLKTTGGGWSKCDLGNNKKIPRLYKYSVLPNCVGWAIGRFNEMAETNSCKYAIAGNAGSFVKNNTKFEVGKTPKLGAWIVWSQKGQAGHVAVVEQVISDTEIIISQSGWNSKSYWWKAKHQKGADGNWLEGDDKSWMTGYKFEGFIYNPDVVEEKEPILPLLKIDGSWGKLTTTALQTLMHTTVDGVISGQHTSLQPYLPAISTQTIKYVRTKYNSDCIYALQKHIGCTVSGQLDRNTVRTLQEFLTKKGFYKGNISAYMQRETVSAFQKYLNTLLLEG